MSLQTPNQKEASIKQTILYVGLDVDDTRYHGSALNKNTGEVIDFQCRPTLKDADAGCGCWVKSCNNT